MPRAHGSCDARHIDLHVEIAGSGPPLLLLHAGVADARMWDPVWETLAAQRRVIRYDARGFGRSPDPGGDWCPHEDALAVLDEAGVDAAHLVGASMGGYTALEVAAVAPERVLSVTVAAGAAGVLEPPPDLVAEWEQIDELCEAGDFTAANEREVRLWAPHPAARAAIADVNLGLLRRQRNLPEPAEIDPPLPERLHEIAAPVLVVTGDADVPNAIAWCEHLAAELPDARLVRWPGAAHMLTLERPQEFAELVLA